MYCDREKYNRYFAFFFSIIWILILGLRHPSMGVDLRFGTTDGYLGGFIYIYHTGWLELLSYGFQNYEIGYIIFNKLLSYVSTNYQILLISCSAISIGIFSYSIYKNSRHIMLSFFILIGLPCFMMNYSGLRQSIATAITFLSYEMIKERDLKKFIFIIIFASLFHYSAILFLIAYPIYHIKLKKIVILFSLIIPAIVYIFKYPLFSILSKILKNNAVIDNNNSFVLFLVFYMIYVFTVFFGNNNKEETGLRNLFFIAVVCQAFSGVYNTAIRVGYYFMPYLVFLLPIIIDRIKCKNINSGYGIYTIILLCFSSFGLYSLYTTSWAMANPYIFCWE